MKVDAPTEIHWRELVDFITERLGLHFPPERLTDIQRGLASIAKEFNLPNSAACAEWILTSSLTKAQLHTIASHLTVGETYFFREKRTFSVLTEHVLPELIQTRRKTGRTLKIWSAACCTGEEPYTLAITLRRLIPDLNDWHITILATDINERFLQKAAAGVYGEWSFRESPPWLRDQFFNRTAEGRYEIRADIKAQVSFANINLVEDDLVALAGGEGTVDLIFCRNVLMYFSLPKMQKVIGNLHRLLVKAGWLVVSPSETCQSLFFQFKPVNFPGVIFYQRSPVPAAKGSPENLPASVPSLGPLQLTFTLPPLLTIDQLSIAPKLLPPPETLPPVSKSEDQAPALSTETKSAPNKLAALARSQADAGKLSEALATCEQWLTAEKLNPSAHYLHALILQELHRSVDARNALLKAIYLQPHFVLAYFALGNLAAQAHNVTEAERHFTTALNLLKNQAPDEVLPDSGGLTNRRLMEMISAINSLKNQGAHGKS